MRGIILTSRLSNGDQDWNSLKDNQDIKQLNINGRSYEYFANEPSKDNIIIVSDFRSISSDFDYLSERPNTNEENNNCTRVKQILEVIKKLKKQEKLDEFIFAIHWGRVNVNVSNKYTENFKEWITQSNRNLSFLITFWTTVERIDGDEYDAIRQTNYSENFFENFWKKLKARAEQKDEDIIKKNLNSIIYHIAHLFLPLDIDLQGICEVLSPEFSPPNGKSNKEWAEEYYREAFKKSPKEVFEEKLEKAREIVKETAPDRVKGQILDKLKNNGVEILTTQPEGIDLETFITWAQENRNSFHSWFCELSEILKIPTSATS